MLSLDLEKTTTAGLSALAVAGMPASACVPASAGPRRPTGIPIAHPGSAVSTRGPAISSVTMANTTSVDEGYGAGAEIYPANTYVERVKRDPFLIGFTAFAAGNGTAPSKIAFY